LQLFSRLRVPASTIPPVPPLSRFGTCPPAVAYHAQRLVHVSYSQRQSSSSQQRMPGLLSTPEAQINMKQTAGENVSAEKANLREQFDGYSVASTDSSDSSSDAPSLCVPEIVVTPPNWPSSAEGGLRLDFSCQGWYVTTDCFRRPHSLADLAHFTGPRAVRKSTAAATRTLANAHRSSTA
jgi:hypothetical protein